MDENYALALLLKFILGDVLHLSTQYPVVSIHHVSPTVWICFFAIKRGNHGLCVKPASYAQTLVSATNFRTDWMEWYHCSAVDEM